MDFIVKTDFYLLNYQRNEAFLLFVCRLIRKAFYAGYILHVLVENMEEQNKLDNFLWTFNATDFIPHTISIDVFKQSATKILISDKQLDDLNFSACIILNSNYVVSKSNIRVMHVIDNNHKSLIKARKLYRNYLSLEIKPSIIRL